jgi:hypothetical protein
MTEGRSYSDLATLNCELGLPVQGPNKVIFNSTIGHAGQLIPFEFLTLEIPPGPFRDYPQVLGEEYLTWVGNTFPGKYVSPLNCIIHSNRNPITFATVEPTLAGRKVFVRRTLFFQTGSPFISVDTIEETQHPFPDYSDLDPMHMC